MPHIHGGDDAAASLAPAPVADPRLAARLVVIAALATTTAAVAGTAGPVLGLPIATPVLVLVAAGAVLVELVPARATAVAAAVGVATMLACHGLFAAFELSIVALLFLARRRTMATAFIVGALVIALPKHLYHAHADQPDAHSWLREPYLALIIFVTLLAWRTRRDGRLPAAAFAAGLAEWAVLYFFPAHAVYPMAYGPGELFRERRFDPPGVLIAAALATGKALAHSCLRRFFPDQGYAVLDAARAATAGRLELWAIVLVGYVDVVVVLSGLADLAVMVGRLYGWPLAAPFRCALLAWNPAELWRRWGVYNRKWLLQMVYFPLGGGERHRGVNVLATFLTSALVLHTGWFGSKYWVVGTAGWRDEALYFLLQALLVCAYLAWRDRRGPASRSGGDHQLRLTPSRVIATVATQAASALVHVVVLAQMVPLVDRFRIIARCLGLA